MRTRLLVMVAALGLLTAAVPVWAHHAFAAEFDQNKPVKVRGAVVKWELTNPHSWIHMDVKGTDDKVVDWAIETGPTNALIRAGIRRTDFVVGTEIIVDGFLAKNGTPTINGREIKFADGRQFFMGSSGTGAPGEAGPSK